MILSHYAVISLIRIKQPNMCYYSLEYYDCGHQVIPENVQLASTRNNFNGRLLLCPAARERASQFPDSAATSGPPFGYGWCCLQRGQMIIRSPRATVCPQCARAIGFVGGRIENIPGIPIRTSLMVRNVAPGQRIIALEEE